jgi:hypothetical protein
MLWVTFLVAVFEFVVLVVSRARDAVRPLSALLVATAAASSLLPVLSVLEILATPRVGDGPKMTHASAAIVGVSGASVGFTAGSSSFLAVCRKPVLSAIGHE